jgi:hypothetical protein
MANLSAVHAAVPWNSQPDIGGSERVQINYPAFRVVWKGVEEPLLQASALLPRVPSSFLMVAIHSGHFAVPLPDSRCTDGVYFFSLVDLHNLATCLDEVNFFFGQRISSLV